MAPHTAPQPTTSPTLIEKEEDEGESTRRMDPELKVMAAMIRQLDLLEEKAKPRVIAWLADRYRENATN